MSIPALRSRATFGSGGAPRLFAQPRSCPRRWTGNHSHRLVPQQMILIVRLAVSRALLSPPWREACSSDCTTRGIGNAAAIRIAGAGGRRWAARSNGGCRHATSDSTTRVRPRRNGNGRTTRTRRSSSAIGDRTFDRPSLYPASRSRAHRSSASSACSPARSVCWYAMIGSGVKRRPGRMPLRGISVIVTGCPHRVHGSARGYRL
ncbi:MAG: hypothetical protein V7647_313 [Acidobacteriota bacterium]